MVLVAAACAQAAETPTITISKSDKLAIAIGSLGGADGAQAAKILQNDLAMSGYFTIASLATRMRPLRRALSSAS